MRELEIHLLGHFEIAVDGVLVEEQRWVRKKAKLLLKVLALAPGHKIQREQIIAILWPDSDLESAVNNLHKVIHAARRALEPELSTAGSRFIITKDLFLALAEEVVWIDADEFERMAAEAMKTSDNASLRAALELYRGDLLMEDLYEDWSTIRRERLRLLHQRLLERLAANLEAQGDEAAIEVLNRLISINVANEDAHRRLMRVYNAMGQRHLALQQYRLCTEALNKELDVAPEAATTRLYESLLAGTVEPPAKSSASPYAALAANPDAKHGPVASRAILWWASMIALLVMGGIAWNLLFRAPRKPAAPVSLAILPLRRESDNGEVDAAADGITEELINITSRLSGIRVMARGTVFVYKGRTDSREVGRELKVTSVVSGYLRQQGQTAAIGLELIDISDGARVWGRSYSGPVQNLAALQKLLATDLTKAIVSKLGSNQQLEPVRKTTGDAEAFRLYLTGRSYSNQRTTQGLRNSLTYYQRAIDRDAGYALAYAGLSDSYGLLGFNQGPHEDYYSKARTSAEKALSLDASLAEAQTSLAMVSALYDWNWPVAEAQFRRAIQLNDGYSTAHHWYGVHLGAMGRFEDSQRELNLALNLDPLSAIVSLNLGYPAYYQRRYLAAIQSYKQVLATNPNFIPAHDDCITAYLLAGDSVAAANEAVQFLRLSGETALADRVAAASHQSDVTAGLRVWLEDVELRAAREFVSAMIPARLAACLKDEKRFFHWLELAWQQHSPQLVYIAVDPLYDTFRTDPRFQQILSRLGLPRR